MRAKRATICHFYAEIAKFGLIVTYLKLFGGKLGGGGKIFFGGGKCPLCPPLAPPLIRSHCFDDIMRKLGALDGTMENFGPF